MQQLNTGSHPRSFNSMLHVVIAVAFSVAALAGCGDKSVGTADASQQVDALFAPLTAGIQPGAAVMVVRDGEIVHAASYGYADLDNRIPITPDSAFRLASVSKQFTAMAIMVLAESGALAYDDPVSRYLPQLAPYEGVTIRHLMTHTGGLPEYYDVIDTASGMPTNADALVLLGEMGKSDFPPGERYEYSNPGYDMLAPLVEAASGTDFASFMRERVFRPAGMQHSLIYDHTRPVVPQRAFGYEPNGDGFSLNDDDPLNAIVGSGGVYSTLKDFFRWDQALYTEVLVSRAALDEALTPARLNNGETTDYGFGWRLDEYDGRRRVRHGGSWIGFRSHIARYPDDRFSIVILSNRADFRPDDYVDPITAIYLGGGKP
jgi:CubicO group peptidase (beta-lactamase class C family)